MILKKIFRDLKAVLSVVTFLSLVVSHVQADALVMIQGYLSKGGSWRESGITDILRHHGWQDGGQLFLRQGQVYTSRPLAPSGRQFYTLELHSDAPLMFQLQELTAYLAVIKSRHPDEPLVLLGHSAGGVLGRLYMVQHPDSGVTALITIASPHLGTEAAELGVMAGRSPLGLFSRLLGKNDALNKSQGLYVDLMRERPGGLLYWLNRQQHPVAHYVSIVRSDDLSWIGDLVVPEWSQDMNRVAALRGRARTIPTSGGHAFEEADGLLLVRILNSLGGP
jgi:pimeloyl-ACP methyl ester carboxylesterase